MGGYHFAEEFQILSELSSSQETLNRREMWRFLTYTSNFMSKPFPFKDQNCLKSIAISQKPKRLKTSDLPCWNCTYLGEYPPPPHLRENPPPPPRPPLSFTSFSSDLNHTLWTGLCCVAVWLLPWSKHKTSVPCGITFLIALGVWDSLFQAFR